MCWQGIWNRTAGIEQLGHDDCWTRQLGPDSRNRIGGTGQPVQENRSRTSLTKQRDRTDGTGHRKGHLGEDNLNRTAILGRACFYENMVHKCTHKVPVSNLRFNDTWWLNYNVPSGCREVTGSNPASPPLLQTVTSQISTRLSTGDRGKKH